MTLAADKKTEYREGVELALPVAGTTEIYAGALVCVNAAGYAVPGDDAAALQFVGIAREHADNSGGSNGDITVLLRRRGLVEMKLATAITIANQGDAAYLVDDESADIAANVSHHVYCGTIAEMITTASAWVDIEPATVGANAVPTETIADKAVTTAKMADLTRGSILSGQTSGNRPAALVAKDDGKILVGDGEDLKSVAVSGDVTLANSGAVALRADSLKTVYVSLDAADIKTLKSANSDKGVEIIAAPGADKMIEFVSAALFYDYDGVNAYTAANGLTFNVEATAVSALVAATLLQATADRIAVAEALSTGPNADAADLVDKPLYLKEGASDPTGSSTETDQLLVRVTYRIHDFS